MAKKRAARKKKTDDAAPKKRTTKKKKQADDAAANLGFESKLWLAADLLQRLLKDEIKVRFARNVVQGRTFSEMLQQAMRSYHNRAIATHEIIEELLKLAKEIRDSGKRHTELGLTEDERCFYDALAQNNSAIEAMGIDELKVIAAELVTKVRKSVTIDWTVRESARSKIRVMVRRILRSRGYPPNLQAEAVKLVLEQEETMCEDWAA